MPELDSYFLAGCLLQAGPVETNGMGVVEISPQRLESWMRITGQDLTPWQAETVLAMSRGYAAIYGDEKAPAPYASEQTKYAMSMAMKAAARAGRK